MRSFLKGFALSIIVAGASPALTEPSFVPIYRDNFPDPHIIRHGNMFVAYSTNYGLNMPMLASRDLVNWAPVPRTDDPSKPRDGMPVLAPWVEKDRTWAPEVMQVGSNWLLYYTARSKRRQVQCIGVATANNPLGPFVDNSTEPLVCQYDEGGTIDANPFRDSDGKLYLYYKSDGNAVGKTSYIWGQRLSDDGRTLAGAPVRLIKDDAKWEWKLVEAPAMVRSPDGAYQMFYSAAYYGWDPNERLSRYATGYANCSGPMGPCQDAPENPILNSFNDREAGCLSGPGHPGIFQAGGRHFIAFHAWAATRGCRKAEDERFLYIAPLFWKDGKPQIGPSLRQQRTGKGERG
jgi:beta-xylosidase